MNDAQLEAAFDRLDTLSNEDHRRSAEYCIEELLDGKREAADQAHLAETLTRLVGK